MKSLRTIALSPRLAVVAIMLSVVVAFMPFSIQGRLSLVFLTLVALVVADIWLAVDPNQVTVSRQVPASVSLHSSAEMTWSIVHTSSRPLRVAISDELLPSLRVQQRQFDVVVSPSASTTVRSVFQPSRRGLLAWDKLGVRVYGPLLLAGRQRRMSYPVEIRVYPDFRSRRSAELRIKRSRVLDVGLRVTRAKGTGTEFDSLRDYTPDDQFRRIDWAATRRAGKPIVRDYRTEQNQTVVCMVDLGRSMAAHVDGTPQIEHAMDAVLALATVAGAAGDHVGLVAFDSRVRRLIIPSRTSSAPSVLARALFELQPSLDESDYFRAFAETMKRFRRRSYIMLFTDLSSAALTDNVVPALASMGRRHVVGIASPTDPELVGWSQRQPIDPGAAYLRAAACAELAQRRNVIEVVRRRGHLVVDADPGAFAGSVVDSYLSLKSQGRL